MATYSRKAEQKASHQRARWRWCIQYSMLRIPERDSWCFTQRVHMRRVRAQSRGERSWNTGSSFSSLPLTSEVWSQARGWTVSSRKLLKWSEPAPPDPTSKRCCGYSTIQAAGLQRCRGRHGSSHRKVTLTVQACNLRRDKLNMNIATNVPPRTTLTLPTARAALTDSAAVIHDVIWIPRVFNRFSSQMKGRRKQVWSFSISTTDWLW